MLRVRVPGDYLLRRDVCSYGYFLLAPNRWDPEREELWRWVDFDDGPAEMRIAQPGAGLASGRDAGGTARLGEGTALRIGFDRSLRRGEQMRARAMVGRMLRLDECAEDIAGFHRVDPRWKASGRGRLFRSPTFFEDLIKTVTNCNVQWSGTMRMNERLCAVVNRAFPRAAQLARRRPATLRTRCGLGYRDGRVVELAKIVAGGGLDVAWLEDRSTSDEEVERALVELPGIGPFAAANVMQLLGRYSRLALDTETMRHGRVVLGMEEEGRALERRLHAHYSAFGDERFRSYWFELWSYYEGVKGRAWTWDASITGREFTAAHLKRVGSGGARAG